MNEIISKSDITVLKNKNRICKKIRSQRYLLFMLAPGVIWLLIFAYTPLLGWVMAFTDYKLGQGFFSGAWVGLEHFKDFLSDTSSALNVIRNTLVINISSLFVNLFFGGVIAVLINEIKINWYKKVVQSCSFFPFFISFVIVYSIFNTFLSVNEGLLNVFFIRAGVIKDGINFLGDENMSWALIVFINCWKLIGYNSVIFLASIANISQEQYESAEIDGAGRFEKILHITIPGLIPTLVVLLVMNSGWIFSSNFEQYYLFTNATNMATMEVFDIYIYRYGLRLLNFSYATAVGVIKTFVSLLLILATNTLLKKITERGIL